MSLSIDPNVVDKYKAGFNECRNEVMRFLSTCEGVTVDVRTRLLSHLASCIRCIQSLQVKRETKMVKCLFIGMDGKDQTFMQHSTQLFI